MKGRGFYFPRLVHHHYALRITYYVLRITYYALENIYRKESQMAATRTMANEAVSDHAESASFERFAGFSAIVAGVVGVVYSLAFVVLKAPWLYSLALLVGGILTTAA